MSNSIELTFTQCKQIAANNDLRDTVEALNDQPEFMQFGQMGVDSMGELLSIQNCGTAGNAHKSVFYYEASQCMNVHGDEVLTYIEESLGQLPDVSGKGWTEMASVYLSCAVELWCGQFDLEGVDWD